MSEKLKLYARQGEKEKYWPLYRRTGDGKTVPVEFDNRGEARGVAKYVAGVAFLDVAIFGLDNLEGKIVEDPGERFTITLSPDIFKEIMEKYNKNRKRE